MAKKLLAIAAALTLLVCGVCVFSIAPVGAASFDGDIEAYAPSASDFVANDLGHVGEGGRIQWSDIDGGGVHFSLNAANTARLGYNYNKELTVNGLHFVIDNLTVDSNEFCLLMGGAPSKGAGDHPDMSIVQFTNDGGLTIHNGGGVFSNEAVIKAMFEGEQTSFAFAEADGTVTITLSNVKGEISAPFSGYGDKWTDHSKVYLAFATNSSNGMHKFDVLAFHDGADECANKPVWWPDYLAYAPSVSDFVANDPGHATEGGRIQWSGLEGGGVHYSLNAASTARLGLNWGKKLTLNGTHIVIANLKAESGTAAFLMGATAPDGYSDHPVRSLVNFINDGTLNITTHGNAIEGSEAIKAMFDGAQTVISFAVVDNEVYVTVSNTAGVSSGKFPGYGTEWTDRTYAYLSFATQGAGGMHEVDILAFHDGAAECAYMGGIVTDLIAAIDAIGEVTLNSGAAIKAAEETYASLSDEYKALVTNVSKLTAARAAFDELAVSNVETLIAAIGTVSADSKAAIEAAEKAYAALDANQKAMVTSYETLTAARKAYNDMTGITAADEAAAAEVDALIDAIGEVTLDSEADIKAAEDAYAALTDDQKAYVKGLETLTVARLTHGNLVAVKPVNDAIAALGEVTVEAGDAIKAANAAYKKLNDTQKTYVTDAKKLEDAVAAYEKLAYDTYVQQYESEILVKVGELSPYAGIVEAEMYEEGKGVMLDAWAASDHWACRAGYAYAVGLDGLKIVLKGVKGIETSSLGLMDKANDWVDVEDSMICFMLCPKPTGEWKDAPYGFLRAHRKYESMGKSTDVWFSSFKTDVWADDELVLDFVMISDTVVAVFVDGQYMGDVTLEELGVDNVEAVIPHFGFWAGSVQSYYVYSITSKADATAIQNVVDLIDAIGEVDVNDEDCVARFEAAFNAYRALTKAQRGYVTNADKLEEALAKFEGVEEEEPTEEPTEQPTEQPTEEPEDPTENPKTGEGFAVLPIAMLIAAAGLAIISRKRK